MDLLPGPLGQLLEAVNAIRQDLEVLFQPQRIIAPNLSAVLEGLRLYVFATGNPFNPGQDFVQARPIQRFVPLTRAVADSALTLVVTWNFFRVMFGHGFRNKYTLRILLPRVMLAVVLINFSDSLVQAAIDSANVVSNTVVRIEPQDYIGVLRRWFTDGFAPGLQALTVTALFASYAVLAIAYILRFALLVVLTILAPVAGLLFVLPETHRYAREWATLFAGALIMQPAQLLVIQIGFATDASFEQNSIYPVRHLFALATLIIAFKVPGAFQSASRVASKASSLSKREANHAMHAVERVLVKV
ncbi:MAG: hypothetical protein M3024_12160 [Candidatus Dormibacteraeota bacterium]|nr:hypothetical protein [Candidatus Dormibacteraeota bacterium]MDQ6899829.1 hypothetical protein [Candidatus Dormibacteraeota bacterium]